MHLILEFVSANHCEELNYHAIDCVQQVARAAYLPVPMSEAAVLTAAFNSTGKLDNVYTLQS